ncbi:MAG: alanine racemase [Lachnospiraceae bacterium]|nr:alanine racemase [Lachnospiraceae bacterium]
MKRYDRLWAEIDLDLFDRNLETMHGRLNENTSIIGVVKTDGYGHGAQTLAAYMQQKDYVSGFATASVEEALVLRKNGIKKPILVLGFTFHEGYETMINEDIRTAVFTDKMIADMSRHAQLLGKEMKVHIAVDTGMNRIGIRPDDSGIAFVKKAMEAPGICIEGIFTHFATADEKDKTKTCAQLERFTSFIERIRKELGLEIPICHCSNSAAIVDIPQANMDAVRAGIILYGMHPSDEVDQSLLPLEPILSLYSKVAFIKDVEPGQEISYGGTFVVKEPMRVATIPVGYGDGYPRSLSNKGYVLIAGKKAPILGRVCMDQIMVDVTDIPEAKTSDRVTLIGKDGNERITMEMLGELSGRFNYELACCLNQRVPRIYMKNGEICEIVDLITKL